jgi:hypothetical protein
MFSTLHLKRYSFVEGIEIFVNINAPDDQYIAMKKNLTDTIVNQKRSDLLVKFTQQARLDVDRK